MKNEPITTTIAKNINYALEAIPRALTQQKKEKSVRKSQRSSGSKARKSTKRGGARRSVRAKAHGMGVRARRGARKSIAAKRGRAGARKARKTRRGASRRRVYQAPLVQAA